LAAGEITDKAYINQRAVLKNRATVVAALYGEGYSPHIIRLHPRPRPSITASSGAA
jgi:feruloyl-CoA synthase